MHRPLKVVAYVVRDGRILVFRHADHAAVEQAGIQVPAGTGGGQAAMVGRVGD